MHCRVNSSWFQQGMMIDANAGRWCGLMFEVRKRTVLPAAPADGGPHPEWPATGSGCGSYG
jgi:hypothetical protein